MSSYTISALADADIRDIARLSISRWGIDQARHYRNDLLQAFDTLAAFPGLGRDVGPIRRGCFRFEHASHVIFFRKTAAGIHIVRVLHERQLPTNYL